MLKQQADGSLQAVNLAADYCDSHSPGDCANLSAQRSARLPLSLTPELDIVDSEGGTTRLRWEAKSAKEYRPPIGDPAVIAQVFPFNNDLTSRYLVGITLPGSSAEDITVAYASHDPEQDTHDDIRVASITKHGVTSTYEYSEYWPFGKHTEIASVLPSGAGQTLEGRWGEGLLDEYDDGNWNTIPETEDVCWNAVPPVLDINGDQNQPEFVICTTVTTNAGGGFFAGFGGINLPDSPEIASLPSDLQEDEASGSQIFELTINASISGEMISKSRMLRPRSNFGMARRRLLYVEDAHARRTEYRYDVFDEVAGEIYPEGNSVRNTLGPRGNIIASAIVPKTGSLDQPLVTALTYPESCEGIPLARCNKPLTITDPRGYVTEYTYNDIGQVTREVRAAPSPGAARPTVVNEYTLRTAYIKGSGGSITAAGPPISMLTRSYTCIASAVCDENTPAADKVVTDYDYGPPTGLNNLLLRGMSVTAFNTVTNQLETLTTCYTYNYFGERIAETQPKAGLTSCP